MKGAKRSVSLRGHRTSISLEPEFHVELRLEAERRGVSYATLVSEIDEARPAEQSLSSALRVFVLRALQARTSR